MKKNYSRCQKGVRSQHQVRLSTRERERELSRLSSSPSPLCSASALKAPGTAGGGTCGIYRSAVAPRTDAERINEASCAGGIKADAGSSTGLQLDPGAVKSSFITRWIPATVPKTLRLDKPAVDESISHYFILFKFGLINHFYVVKSFT